MMKTSTISILRTPTKPDARAALLVLVALMVGSTWINSEVGFLLMTVWVWVVTAMLGLARRLPPIILVYLVLRGFQALCGLAGEVPVIPFVGVILTLICRMYPVYIFMWMMMVKIPMGELMAALAKLRVPNTLLIVAMVVYRYVPTLAREYSIINTSLKLRNLDVWWRRWLCHPVAQLEMRMVPIIMRSGRISDELSAVAICKGLDPAAKRSSLVTPRIQAFDLALIAVTVVVIATLILSSSWMKVTFGL